MDVDIWIKYIPEWLLEVELSPYYTINQFYNKGLNKIKWISQFNLARIIHLPKKKVYLESFCFEACKRGKTITQNKLYMIITLKENAGHKSSTWSLRYNNENKSSSTTTNVVYKEVFQNV